MSSQSTDIRKLLAEQRAVVEMALAFNDQIAKQLSHLGGFWEMVPENDVQAQQPPNDIVTKTKDVQTQQPPNDTVTKAKTVSIDESIRSSSCDSAEHQTLTSDELTIPLLAASVRQLSVESNCSIGKIKASRESRASFVGLADDPVEEATIHKALCEDEESLECEVASMGPWHELAHSTLYQDVAVIVVIFNLVWIGYETDHDTADVLCNAPLYIQIISNVFCIFFAFDVIVRVLAKETFSFAFVVDLFLVVQMIWETWIQVALYLYFGSDIFANGSGIEVLRVLRLFRLTRAMRIHKALSIMPELMVLVKGFLLAMKSVLAILFLMTICIYFFGVLFTKLHRMHSLVAHFDSVPQSMEFLLVQILSGVDPEFMSTLVEAGVFYYFMFLVYIFVSQMTLMNMLIGVVCEVMSGAAGSEKDRQDLVTVEKVVANMVHKLDKDRSDSVSKTEFHNLLEHPEILSALTNLDVDVRAFMKFTLFAMPDDEVLTVPDLTRLVHQCRLHRACTVKDILENRKFISSELENVYHELKSLHVSAGDLRTMSNSLHACVTSLHSSVHKSLSSVVDEDLETMI